MASAKLYTMEGRELDPIDLSDAVFDVVSNEGLVHDVAVALMNAKRQGNAATKRRAERRGGGTKPFRQKGTGRARQGSSREPQMRGGGVVFGPHKRSYRQNVPLRSRRTALRCMLSDRLRNEALCVLDSLTMEAPKTSRFAELMSLVAPERGRTLFVTAESDRSVLLSARNIPKVEVKTAADLNALDVLNAFRVVLSRDAVVKLEERLS
ncbi:MAG: 50S ribosomal protein L4 [Nitrospiraceae bacterium]|nr:50S ribosomal protein L4 [Nitrospiraceae bacterium]